MTGDEAAAMLGVSRRTVYRWVDAGRIGYPLDRADILNRHPQKRRRGPQRDPRSLRYTRGRHTFSEREGGGDAK